MRALKQLIGYPMPKNIDEIIKESIKFRYPFQHFSTVLISDKNIIKGVAQSKPNNLITDNFGTWLAAFFRAPVVGIKTITLKDSGGTDRALVHIYYNIANSGVFNIDTGDKIGTSMQVGSGSSAAARSDYSVETAFGNAPEDDLFDTGTGSYAVGSIAVAGAIIAGGAGTIAETCLFGSWTWVDTGADFLLFHDILSSTEAFVGGNTITVAYTINL